MQLSDVFTSVPLTNVSLAYKPVGYISEMLAPLVKVKKDAGKIYNMGMDNLRIVPTYRSIGGKPQIVSTEVSSSDHYSLEDHVLGEYIAEEIYENAESPLKPRTDTTEALTDRVWLDKEKALADVMTSTSVMTKYTTLTGTDQWSDHTNSDPIGDINTGKESVRLYSGKIANTLVLAHNAMLKLIYHPAIKDMYPGANMITLNMLADGLKGIFGFENILVGSAQYNNSNKGGTDTLTDIWSKVAIVCYIEKTPSLKSRTLANTYHTKAPRRVQLLTQGGGSLELIQRKSDYLQVSDKYDQVLVDVTCGYLIDACIA